MPIHPDIEAARLSCATWRVLPSERGWRVWRFYPWRSAYGGWRIVEANVPSSADGWVHVLQHMGLPTDVQPAPALPPGGTVMWGEL